MNMLREFTVGDRLTSLAARLYRPGPTPVVLDAAETVVFRMVASNGTVKVNDAPAVVVSRGDSSTGHAAEVRYDWGVGDVNTAGEYHAWFIRQLTGDTEHFPTQDPGDPEFVIIFREGT